MASAVALDHQQRPSQETPPHQGETGVVGFVLAGAVAATIIQLSLLWDMSWHFSIGRDTFWSPPHAGIYVGTTLGALSAAWLVLRCSREAWKSSKPSRWVEVLGFHGPSGAWVVLLGSAAMLAGGFFDDWWHRVYGLDVTVLSPAHVVLFFFGMAVLQLGFWMLAAVAIGHTHRHSIAVRRLGYWLAGTIVLVLAVLGTEQTFQTYMHGARFWLVTALLFPFLLIGLRTSGSRWGATSAAAVYTIFRLAVLWILPLFSAEPRLGPVFSPVTHMVPPDFPLLILAPAVVLDLLLQRSRLSLPSWKQAFRLGTAFVIVMLLVQWPFASFLMSDASRIPLFATDNFRYNLPTLSFTARGEFFYEPAWYAVTAIGASFLVATISARGGLALSQWARRLCR